MLELQPRDKDAKPKLRMTEHKQVQEIVQELNDKVYQLQEEKTALKQMVVYYYQV